MDVATVIVAGGLRVMIYPTDHDPPQARVFGDGKTRIALGGSVDDVDTLSSTAKTRSEVRRAVAVVEEHRALLAARWSELHG